MTRPIAIDLFAGAGGMSLGFEQAGFDIVAAVEIDPIHAAVHKYNFPNCAVIAKSVTELTGKDVRKLAALGNSKIDVVFGGAPCQGFSMIGQRALDDPRNALVHEFVRLVSELAPRTFVFENVKGLTIGKHRIFLDELIDAFEGIGYRVRRDWQVLNAANYGVPQDRQRLILIGARNDIPLPEYPEQMTHAAGTTNCGSPAGPTCRDALDDLPDAEVFSELINSDEVISGALETASQYALELRCTSARAWHFGYRRIWDRSKLTASLRTDHSKISRHRFATTNPGEVEPISRFFKLPPDGVANTLRAGTDAARGAFTSPRPIHYAYPRCVTVREMARLHGFPDWFRFHVTKWHGARQIGNAVPPPLARAVAKQVMDALAIKPSRPKAILRLGPKSLLMMGMSEASAFWSIKNPIGNRNKKSGVVKRRQSELDKRV